LVSLTRDNRKGINDDEYDGERFLETKIVDLERRVPRRVPLLLFFSFLFLFFSYGRVIGLKILAR